MPGIPANITIEGRTPATIKGRVAPLINTAEAARGGFRAGDDSGDSPVSTSNWLAHSQASRAPAPLLRFTDLISGPATGLGDSLGSGVIVTIWAQGVGDTQGSGQVYFTDLNGTKRAAAHVYYWKRADGVLPSGPARLWYSHLMQEIAFSIPAGSADGAGTITVETGGQTSNTLPFTVRAGNIYHVTSAGSDNGNGSFASPWLTPDKGLNTAPAGSTTYLHDVTEGSSTSVRGMYWRSASASSSLDAQYATIAYPGKRPRAVGKEGMGPYTTEGWVISKMVVEASNTTEGENGQPAPPSIQSSAGTWCIKTTKNGRLIANQLTDITNGCASRYQGAIVGTAKYGNDNVGNCRTLGNEIYGYGCEGSNKLHHTSYLSLRGSPYNPQVQPWEWGFNFLHGNHAKFGIHQFDQDADNGDILGTVYTHNNVVVGQGGAGISLGATNSAKFSNEWEMYNNVLIDTGRAAAWNGIDVDTSDGSENSAFNFRDGGGGVTGLIGKTTVKDNLVFGVADDGQTIGGRGALGFSSAGTSIELEWTQNVSIIRRDLPYVSYGFQTSSSAVNCYGTNNAWVCTVGGAVNAVPPSFDASPVTGDPLVTRDGAIVVVGAASSMTNKGAATGHDIYGVPRPGNSTLGPVEAI